MKITIACVGKIKEKYLKVKLEENEDNVLNFIEKDIIKDYNSQYAPILVETIQDSYTRLIEPSIEREIRSDLTERAEEQESRQQTVHNNDQVELFFTGLVFALLAGKTFIQFSVVSIEG